MLNKIITIFCFSTFLSCVLYATYFVSYNFGFTEGQKAQLFLEIPKSSPTPTPKTDVNPQVKATKTPVIKKISWGGPELWEEVNNRRVLNGVNPLGKKDELCTIAAIRLNELRELGKLDGHEGFSQLSEKRTDLKWIFEKYNLAEFLIVGYDTPKETVDAWEHTLGHKSLVAGGEWVWGCVYAQDTFGVAITAY
ncbi:MAG: hypothetical protein ABH819_02690 [Patescibacteria group bacterium]